MVAIPFKKETGISIAFLITLAAAVVWVRTLTVKETYAFVKNERELRAAEEALQFQRLRLVRATAPAKLQVRAENIGLAVPLPEQVVKWRGRWGRP